MTSQQFLKGLLMAVVGVVVTFFSTTPIDFLLMGVTALCAVLTYAGKNLIPLLHSDSQPGQFSLINIGSALLVALGSGVLESVGLFLINGAIDWVILIKVVASVTFTYFGATLFAPPFNVTKKRIFIK